MIVGEQAIDDAEAQRRADWEAVVRAARARRVTVTVRGWRESDDGDLWEPGRLVRLTDEWLGFDRDLLVSSVVYSIGESGTIARLSLVPEGAFLERLEPEPAARDSGVVNWWG